MRVLVTGVAGFIGSFVMKRLLERGDEVVGLDNLNDYYDPTLKIERLHALGFGTPSQQEREVLTSSRYPRGRFIRMSLEDRAAVDEVFELGPFDRVCNLAAQAGVRYSLENPRAYIDSNVVGFLNILEACRAASTPHLIYASSSSVYGLDDTRPFSTHHGANHPISLYAATKKSNELMAHTYSHLFKLPTTGLRFFTVYGPQGRPDMAYYKFAKLMQAGKSIDVYNQGDLYRDFTYIDDIVEGVIRIIDSVAAPSPTFDAKKPDPATSSAPYRVYNIGNNRPVKLLDFIEILEDALKMKAVRNFLPMQPGDVYATEADVDDLEADFGWRPTTSIQDGLAQFAKWFLAR